LLGMALDELPTAARALPAGRCPTSVTNLFSVRTYRYCRFAVQR